MIQKVRRKFNRITILMLAIVLLIPLVAINVLTRFVSYQQTDSLLKQIADSSSYGIPSDAPPPEKAENPIPKQTLLEQPLLPQPEAKQKTDTPPNIPIDPNTPKHNKRKPIEILEYFILYLDKNGNLVSVSDAEQCSESEAEDLVQAVNRKKSKSGYLAYFQYYKKIRPEGTLIVFSDRTSDLQLLRKLLWLSISISIFMMALILFLTNILSKRAVRPIEIAFAQQRQFISDAGHELKTPLTIISANADILHDEIGENKWLLYIQDQIDRMRILIADMMQLTKLESHTESQEQPEFNLSSIVESTALPFESQAFETEKTLHIEVEENLTYRGNSEEIRQMLGIFIDNAFKYSNDNGTIRITLQKNKDKKILKIYNTGMGIRKDEQEKIFLRFYRSDHSRARTTGGYGLGLSIAKRIADKHKIKIQVESEEGKWVCFILTL